MNTKYKIVKAEHLNSDTFMLTVESEIISKRARSGQIVNIKCGDEGGVLLRRPISICSVDRDKEPLILFRSGRYEILSNTRPGMK